MTIAQLPTVIMPLGFLVAIGAFGCADGNSVDGNSGGSGNAPANAGSASGGAPGAAGTATTGGLPGVAGQVQTGGGSTAGSAGGGAGGAPTAGAGGTSTAGMSSGGTAGAGGSVGGASLGGASGAGSGGASGTCTASKATGRTASGTGPHAVVIETNGDTGIKCGTIYRPKDLKGGEKYPILVWGEGACSQDGLANQAALSEIASWGYFVIADGTPGSMNACQGNQNGKPMLDYVTWAIAENAKPCSAYYQSLETTKVAADGFSCGGLMAANVSGDPRFAAIGITSSGLMAANAALYDKIHTPYKIMNGGSGDIAYDNGLRDYQEISSRNKPIIYFSKKNLGHGGDLDQARGNFNRVNLAWLNWQLKGDMTATGKGFLQGATCQFCMASGWTYKAANLP